MNDYEELRFNFYKNIKINPPKLFEIEISENENSSDNDYQIIEEEENFDFDNIYTNKKKKLTNFKEPNYKINNCDNKIIYVDNDKKEYIEERRKNLKIEEGCKMCNTVYICKCCGKVKHMNVIINKHN